MINQLLLIFSTIVIYEFIKIIKFKYLILLNIKFYRKIIKLFFYKKASDFRKEKLILNYSKKLFFISIKLFLILIILLFFMFIINLLSNKFLDLIVSILGISEMMIIFIIYHKFRKK